MISAIPFGKTLDNGGSEKLQFDLVVFIRFPGKVDDRFVDHEFSAASLVTVDIIEQLLFLDFFGAFQPQN